MHQQIVESEDVGGILGAFSRKVLSKHVAVHTFLGVSMLIHYHQLIVPISLIYGGEGDGELYLGWGSQFPPLYETLYTILLLS